MFKKIYFRLIVCFFVSSLVLSYSMLVSASSEFDAIKYKAVHIVESGDTITDIALKYDTTPDEIIKANSILDKNLIFIGQKIYIPVDKSNYLGGGWSFNSGYIDGYWDGEDDKIEGYTFINDCDAVGTWKNIGTCSEIDSFEANLSKQQDYIKNFSRFEIVFAEYGDIKNHGDFAWSAGKLYDYSENTLSLDYIINTINGYKYMFLEYDMQHKIYDDTDTVPNDVGYFVFKKIEKIHTVKPGDTLNEIALMYETTVEKIVQANNIQNPNYITVFQQLLIP